MFCIVPLNRTATRSNIMDGGGGIVACAVWVPQGMAKADPERVELSAEEMRRLLESTKSQLDESEAAGAESEGAEDMDGAESDEGSEEEEDEDGEEDDDDDDDDDDDGDDDDGEWVDVEEDEVEQQEVQLTPEEAAELAQYNLDEYDDEPGVDDTETKGFANVGGLVYHTSNDDDPYITMKDADEQDLDDFSVRPTDNFIAVGRTDQDGLSHVEIHLWNGEEDSFFVHNDMLLSSFPLCLEWLNFDAESEAQTGNLLAVGTMSPVIEIWDLDVLEAAEPLMCLGTPPPKPKKRRRGGKKKKKQPQEPEGPPPTGHTKEVMGLAWNSVQRNLLASSSADCSVKLWDLNTGECLRTYTHHKGKIENLAWNIAQPSVLMTGGHDGLVCVFDTKNPDAVAQWQLDSDIECLEWCPWDPESFLAGTSNGFIYQCDVKAPGETMFKLKAHDSATTAMSCSPSINGLLVSGSTDHIIKIWDIQGASPRMVSSQDPSLGPVYTIRFCPDFGAVIACGGHVGGLKIVNLFESGKLRRHFSKRNPTLVAKAEELVERRKAEMEERARLGIKGGPDDDDDSDQEDWASILSGLSLEEAKAEAEVQEKRQKRLAEKKEKRRQRRQREREMGITKKDKGKGAASQDAASSAQ
eukprot:m.242834 g.242834  ORF g.242834 m.242834 type:complete len:639 (+) comp15337_c1_seq15:121-2037(+)